MKLSTLLIPARNPFPNSGLPVLLYQAALPKEGADFESLFHQNAWTGIWVNGVYAVHHFHATAHEALGCIRGSAVLMLGGPEGTQVAIQAGDAVLLPAGMGHKRLSCSSDFLIAGAYPPGQSPDMQRGDPRQFEALQAISRQAALPQSDPVKGQSGPVLSHWHTLKGRQTNE